VSNRRSVLLACVLSVLQPGLGHLYLGKSLYAVLIPVALVLAYFLARLSGLIFQPWGLIALILLLVAAWLGIIVWAAISAKHTGDAEPSRFQRWYVYVSYCAVLWIAAQGLLAHRAQWFGYEIYRLPTESMADTLLSGDYIVDDSWAYRADRRPQRGDVVICTFSGQPAVSYVRRIVGLPGDEIAIRNGHVLINNQPLNEPYIASAHNTLASATNLNLFIPPDNFFVLGDNRDRSYDSRYIGPVRRADTSGQVRTVWFSYDSKSGVRINRIGMHVS
jgi:signal peptidase I